MSYTFFLGEKILNSLMLASHVLVFLSTLTVTNQTNGARQGVKTVYWLRNNEVADPGPHHWACARRFPTIEMADTGGVFNMNGVRHMNVLLDIRTN